VATLDAAVVLVRRKIMDHGTDALGVGEGTTLLIDAMVEEEIAAAVIRYSNDFPRVVVEDEAGNGTPFYAHTVLASWLDDFSRVIEVEYPAAAVSASHVPEFLDLADDLEQDYRTASTRYFRFPNHTPVASETIRFRYTALHTLTNATDTIPSHHYDAVCDLAAAYCCTRLAARFASSMDSTIAADGTNYRDLSGVWRRMHDEFMQAYRRKTGLPRSGPLPASRTADLDVDTSWGGDRMFHPRRWR